MASPTPQTVRSAQGAKPFHAVRDSKPVTGRKVPVMIAQVMTDSIGRGKLS